MLALILHVRFLDDKRLLKFYFSLCCSLYFGFKFYFFNEVEKCPECYGNELCRFFQNQQIELTWFSCFLFILNPNWTKSVFYGVFNDTLVVIKRKAGRTEFQNFTGYSDKAQNFILCNSVSDLKFLYSQIEGKIEEKRLWLDLKTSIEPLLLTYFQSQGSWPFPKFLGACGDLVVEEYKGEPLTNFFSSDFKAKIHLAMRLLEMANLFTFGHSQLAFYFTDYSLHNLVVDSNNKISLVDLDSVIISNKSVIEGNNFLNQRIHKSEILDEQRYAFSPSDICHYHLSDHNYFSICKYLLSHSENGLLKDIPLELKRSKELLWLLDECSQPKSMSNRFSAGLNLQILLEEIANDYNLQ